jgi:hypothetical protein
MRTLTKAGLTCCMKELDRARYEYMKLPINHRKPILFSFSNAESCDTWYIYMFIFTCTWESARQFCDMSNVDIS